MTRKFSEIGEQFKVGEGGSPSDGSLGRRRWRLRAGSGGRLLETSMAAIGAATEAMLSVSGIKYSGHTLRAAMMAHVKLQQEAQRRRQTVRELRTKRPKVRAGSGWLGFVRSRGGLCWGTVHQGTHCIHVFCDTGSRCNLPWEEVFPSAARSLLTLLFS
jgi:hypothetical protein